ncbi:MAG: hypothetical protein RIR11_4206 [Bacteroidota bacterium]
MRYILLRFRDKSKQEDIDYVVFLVQSYFPPLKSPNKELTIINILGKYCSDLGIQWLLLHQYAQNFGIFIGSYDGFPSIYQLGDHCLLVSQSCVYRHYPLRKQGQSSTTLRW